ncbi:MAG: hypothetical protein ACOCX4_09155 [Planctomycetota bacterium]
MFEDPFGPDFVATDPAWLPVHPQVVGMLLWGWGLVAILVLIFVLLRFRTARGACVALACAIPLLMLGLFALLNLRGWGLAFVLLPWEGREEALQAAYASLVAGSSEALLVSFAPGLLAVWCSLWLLLRPSRVPCSRA